MHTERNHMWIWEQPDHVWLFHSENSGIAYIKTCRNWWWLKGIMSFEDVVQVWKKQVTFSEKKIPEFSTYRLSLEKELVKKSTQVNGSKWRNQGVCIGGWVW
jgi:hypothetical protein